MTTPSSVPAQGEAMRQVVGAMEIARPYVVAGRPGLILSRDSTINAYMDCIAKYDAALNRARALVAASPCAEQPDTQQADSASRAGSDLPDLTGSGE